MTKQATYRIIPGFSGYRVGDDGSVWSTSKSGRTTSTESIDGWRRLTPVPTRKRYIWIRLYQGGTSRFYHVAALVLTAFVSPRSPGYEPAHANGNRGDNRLENLSWKTHIENERDKARHGTILSGEKCWNAKLTTAEIVAIRALEGKMRRCDVAKKFGIAAPTVRQIWKRMIWKQVSA